MTPTFNSSEEAIIGDYLIVELLKYKFSEPKRGDVIIYRGDKEKGVAKFVLKRIIALPGETIEINRNHIKIYPAGKDPSFILSEPYIPKDAVINYKHQIKEMKENEYFLMGDNRINSFDSRFWGPGTRDKIIGRALLRLFPFTEIAFMPGSLNKYQ